MSNIEVERKGEVEWIRLNRPDRMNAYDAEMAHAAAARLQHLRTRTQPGNGNRGSHRSHRLGAWFSVERDVCSG